MQPPTPERYSRSGCAEFTSTLSRDKSAAKDFSSRCLDRSKAESSRDCARSGGPHDDRPQTHTRNGRDACRALSIHRPAGGAVAKAGDARTSDQIEHVEEPVVGGVSCENREMAVGPSGSFGGPQHSTIGRSSCVWMFDSLRLLPRTAPRGIREACRRRRASRLPVLEKIRRTSRRGANRIDQLIDLSDRSMVRARWNVCRRRCRFPRYARFCGRRGTSMNDDTRVMSVSCPRHDLHGDHNLVLFVMM